MPSQPTERQILFIFLCLESTISVVHGFLLAAVIFLIPGCCLFNVMPSRGIELDCPEFSVTDIRYESNNI